MSKHPFQKAIDVINAGGKRTAKEGHKPYKMLHALAVTLGQQMHPSQSFIGKTFNISPNKMNKLAKEALAHYCLTEALRLPKEFQYFDRKK